MPEKCDYVPVLINFLISLKTKIKGENRGYWFLFLYTTSCGFLRSAFLSIKAAKLKIRLNLRFDFFVFNERYPIIQNSSLGQFNAKYININKFKKPPSKRRLPRETLEELNWGSFNIKSSMIVWWKNENFVNFIKKNRPFCGRHSKKKRNMKKIYMNPHIEACN